MTENTSFSDLASVVYRGSEGLDILSGLKTMGYNLRKWPEMAKNTSFADPYGVVYRGSQGIEILLGLENHVL